MFERLIGYGFHQRLQLYTRVQVCISQKEDVQVNILLFWKSGSQEGQQKISKTYVWMMMMMIFCVHMHTKARNSFLAGHTQANFYIL